MEVSKKGTWKSYLLEFSLPMTTSTNGAGILLDLSNIRFHFKKMQLIVALTVTL